MEERLKKFMHEHKCYGPCTKEIYEGQCCDHGKCEYQIVNEVNQRQEAETSLPASTIANNKEQSTPSHPPKKKRYHKLLSPLPPPKRLFQFRTHDVKKTPISS